MAKPNDIDLEKELDKPTEEVYTGEDFEDQEPESIESDDFEDSALFDQEEPDEDPENSFHDKFSPDYLHKTAQRWVKAFDHLQRGIMRTMYRKTMLKDGDADKAKQWARQYEKSGGKMEDIINGDWETKERLDKYTEALKELPFTEADREAIAEPLSELIEKYKHLQLSPEWALVFAVSIVMLPRIEPIMPNLKDLFKGKSAD